MKLPYLEGGRICTAHGVRGLLKVESYCNTPADLAKQKRVFFAGKDGSYKEHRVTQASVAGGFVLLGVEGVPDREAAQALRGVTIYLAREDLRLKPGEVLIADLIGTPVTDADTGKVYGTVSSIEDGAASRLITVATEKGDVILPDLPIFIIKKDSGQGVFVRPIPGFFED